MSTLLLIGDLHLGRVPWRLGGEGLDPYRFGPTEAWHRAVQLAVERRVDAVVLAGDVVDQERDRFEALGPLVQGCQRLAAEGVAVLGVAGNHDHLALPRLAERLGAGFALLGRGGRWELCTVGDVDLLGWSFPRRHHREDPLQAPGLAQALAERRAEAALLGVLHADLDTPGSAYAPVRRQDLEALPPDRWFLGHVHRPEALGIVRCGYLGSLVGLDRGEPGVHGPWLITAAGPGRVTATQVPLGPAHWLDVTVDLSGLETGDDDALHQALEAAFRRARAANQVLDAPGIEVVGASVRWTGRLAPGVDLAGFPERIGEGGRHLYLEDQRWCAVDFTDATRPDLDLATIAQEANPAGTLAGLLLRLEAEGEAAVPEPLRRRHATQSEAPAVETAPDLLALTRSAAQHALEALLAQRPASGGGG